MEIRNSWIILANIIKNMCEYYINIKKLYICCINLSVYAIKYKKSNFIAL